MASDLWVTFIPYFSGFLNKFSTRVLSCNIKNKKIQYSTPFSQDIICKTYLINCTLIKLFIFQIRIDTHTHSKHLVFHSVVCQNVAEIDRPRAKNTRTGIIILLRKKGRTLSLCNISIILPILEPSFRISRKPLHVGKKMLSLFLIQAHCDTRYPTVPIRRLAVMLQCVQDPRNVKQKVHTAFPDKIPIGLSL